METSLTSIALAATYETHNGYKSVTAWTLRDCREATRKVRLLPTAVTVENNSYVRWDGKRFRRWDYRGQPTENEPWGKSWHIAVRDCPSLAGRMERTEKTEEGFRDLMTFVTAALTKGKVDPSRNLYLTRGSVRGEKVYTAQVSWTTMERRKVCYYGITDQPTTLSLQWGYSASHLVRRTEVRFSPVRTETETEPLGLRWDTIPRLERGVMSGTGVRIVYKFADGTISAALTHDERGDEAWREDNTKWFNQCQEEWVLTTVRGHLRNGVYTVDPEMGTNREATPHLSVRGLSALSTKAGRVPTDSPELERIIAQRGELKEALAMAVFAPARVDRMTQTYGDDWMERV